MNRPRLIKGLRIAVIAVCGIVCVLAVVLWVRSCSYCDILGVRLTKPRQLILQSKRDELSVILLDRNGAWTFPRPLYFRSTPMQRIDERNRWLAALGESVGSGGNRWFSGSLRGGNVHALFPHWLIILLSGITALAIGVRPNYRFSLRTLLIATTLIAVVLGLVVWSRR